jgi:hypothetical protein
VCPGSVVLCAGSDLCGTGSDGLCAGRAELLCPGSDLLCPGCADLRGTSSAHVRSSGYGPRTATGADRSRASARRAGSEAEGLVRGSREPVSAPRR